MNKEVFYNEKEIKVSDLPYTNKEVFYNEKDIRVSKRFSTTKKKSKYLIYHTRITSRYVFD